MTLAKYIFRPGINKEGTNYSNEGGWFDADKVKVEDIVVGLIRKF